MSALDAPAVRRRFVLLTALRWLPTGFLIPLLAVYMQERGLSLAQIGLVSAVQAAVVILLELPTGGLADALGRRPVLLVASALDLASWAVFLVAGDVTGFAVAWVLQGVYRALETGPLEAWYVDAALAADPDADIEGGLARAGTVLGLTLGVGSLGTAALTLFPLAGVEPLVVPVVVAMALRCVDLAALAALVREVRPTRGVAALRAGLAGVPVVLRSTAVLLRGSPALLALVAVELLWGGGMTAVELFAGPRMVDLLGDPQRGVAVFGVTAAIAWSISGVGAHLTPRLVTGLGTPARAGAVLRVAQGAGVALIAVVAGPAGLVAGFLGFYLVHGASNAVHYGMVHRLTGPEQRTTMVSANSLASRVGGMAGALGLGAVAGAAGIPAAWTIAAAVLAVAAPLYLVAGRGQAAGPAQPEPGRGEGGEEAGSGHRPAPLRTEAAPAERRPA